MIVFLKVTGIARAVFVSARECAFKLREACMEEQAYVDDRVAGM